MGDKKKQTNRGRLTEIARTLASYGFGHIYRTRMGSKKEQQDAQKLRLAFEELGPTFIKFGQILSTRPDLLPKDYIQELSKLQDKVPPFPFSQIKEIFEEDFKQTLEESFKWVDEEPLASASVAQVHRATTFDGEEVVLKVQRPDMEENLLRDIRLFSRIISMAPETVKSFIVDAEVAIAEIEKVTKIELDFRNEVNALIRFRMNNADRDVVHAPKPYVRYSSKRVLVEDYIEGITNLNKTTLQEAGYDTDDLVQKLVYSFLKQVFEDGFFHGDPHPGNIIIQEGKIVFIDFGLYGELSKENRDKLIEILEAIVLEDIDELMNLLLQLAIVKSKVDRYELYNDLESFFYVYIAKDLKQIDIGRLMTDMLGVAHRHGLIMPNDFVLLAKSLGIVEGVISEFETEVNLMDVAKMYLKDRENYSLLKKFTADNVGVNAYKTATNLFDLPTSMKKLFDTISNGRTRMNIEIMDWDKKSVDINKMVNRVVFAIIIASLILASALIAVSVTSLGLSRLSIVIFLGAGFMGLWLLISIIRSGTL